MLTTLVYHLNQLRSALDSFILPPSLKYKRRRLSPHQSFIILPSYSTMSYSSPIYISSNASSPTCSLDERSLLSSDYDPYTNFLADLNFIGNCGFDGYLVDIDLHDRPSASFSSPEASTVQIDGTSPAPDIPVPYPSPASSVSAQNVERTQCLGPSLDDVNESLQLYQTKSAESDHGHTSPMWLGNIIDDPLPNGNTQTLGTLITLFISFFLNPD